LEILIDKNYVINNESSNTFLWNYKNIVPTNKDKNRKQESILLLAFLFLDFFYIKILILENTIYKEKDIDVDYFDHAEKFFNIENCNIINKAFNIINIENSKADKQKKLPRGYVKLLKDLGILSKSNIASTQKI